MMKAKEKASEKMVSVPESGLLSLVASKLKGRILFPEKVKEAQELVNHIVLKTN